MTAHHSKLTDRVLLFIILISSSIGLALNTSDSGDSLNNAEGMPIFNNPRLLQELGVEAGIDHTQEKADPKHLGGIVISHEAKKLASHLRKITNEEMGVPVMQSIYDSLPFEETAPDLNEALLELSSSIESKLNNYLRVLQTNKQTVENLYERHLKVPIYERRNCCTLSNRDLSWDARYGCYISKDITCDLAPPSAPLAAFNPGRNLTEVFQQTHQVIPSVKWQFFISSNGIHNEFPAHNFNNMGYTECQNAHDSYHRDLYVASTFPSRKNVVIMIDHGNSLSSNQLYVAKSVAKYLLNSLGKKDRVAVIGLSNEVRYSRDDACLHQYLVPLTNEAKDHFTGFIDNLRKQSSPTNHVIGFQHSFEIITNTIGETSLENGLIVYISRGLPSVLTDAKEVLQVIASQNAKLQNRVIINTYAVIDDGKPIMYEKVFLSNVAAQNFSVYALQSKHPNPNHAGIMRSINSSSDLGEKLSDFLTVFNFTSENIPFLFSPKLDQISSGLIIPLTWPCFYDDKVIGVIGFAIDASDLLESITYFAKPDRQSTAFLIDDRGYTVMHPDLARPYLKNEQHTLTDLARYENYPGFDRIKQLMLHNDDGLRQLKVFMGNSSYTEPNHNSQHITIQYRWRKIKPTKMDSSPLVVVIKTILDTLKFNDIQKAPSSQIQSVVYHRLDLMPTEHTCIHLKQLATMETSALFLSPSCYEHSYEHLTAEETKRTAQTFLAYLQDTTSLLSNPGLKKHIQRDVATISKMNKEWLKQYKSSQLNDFVVRRYVSTLSGVFQVFPGTLMNKAFDPVKQSWYRRALESPGRVTLTSPRLDNGGAGYIVSISHSIYEGKLAAMHGPIDRVVAVMGMDVTVGYLYKVLIDQIPVCVQHNIRCFIMDDRGYLIAHQGLIERNGKGPVEQQHLTHFEPVVANDILNHIGLVEKRQCNSYSARTIQRFYQFNTSIAGVLTNLVHGEHCARYQMTAITGTNVFIGIVNQTCGMTRAFCPCSVVDRRCLNCHRMEQTECECPCECQLEMNFCNGDLLHDEDSNPSCPNFPESSVPMVQVADDAAQRTLPQCFHQECSSRSTESSCLGVIDCEWCIWNIGGKTALPTPFCSTQRVCYAGVLGAATPYYDQISGVGQEANDVIPRNMPVGPVAGAIMGCFLLLAVAVYCYRHRAHRYEGQYINPTGGDCNDIGMGSMDQELEDIQPIDDAGNTKVVLATFDNPAAMSPYRVNTNYRPPRAGDSDHGYSTMTPHDDTSEQASTACLEPLIIGRDRYRPSAHNIPKSGMIPPPPSHRRGLSTNSQMSPSTQIETVVDPLTGEKPTTQVNGCNLQHTIIPETTVLEPNQVLANVTVHMVDTH